MQIYTDKSRAGFTATTPLGSKYTLYQGDFQTTVIRSNRQPGPRDIYIGGKPISLCCSSRTRVLPACLAPWYILRGGSYAEDMGPRAQREVAIMTQDACISGQTLRKGGVGLGGSEGGKGSLTREIIRVVSSRELFAFFPCSPVPVSSLPNEKPPIEGESERARERERGSA